jgi:outer membrane protein W
MKKLILLSLVSLLCLPLASYAASIGGAETQGKGKFAIGLDQEFVFDRDMKFDKASWGELDSGETVKVEIDSMYRTMVKASYGVLDNLDVYVKLGTADFKMTDVWTETGEEWHDTAKGKNAFAYGFGAKGTYELKDGWFVGADVQYLRHKNKYSGSGYDALDPADTDSWHGKMTFQEWQVAPYIAKKIGNFVPYLGVKYSDLRIKEKSVDDDGDEDTIKWKADDNVGVFVGTDYKIADNWKLNLEGRFVDETAMSVGATYRF